MIIGEIQIPVPNAESLQTNVAYRRGRPLVGAWAIADEFVTQSIQWLADVPDGAANVVASTYDRIGSVAVIPINGIAMKREGLGGTFSTVATRRLVQQAASDKSISAIVLSIESPGGQVSGTPELASAIFAARQSKKVIAVIEDIGASAAYWLASQAHEVYANRTAHVGSIGAFTVIGDFSGYLEKWGIKAHVVRSGAHKGAGAFGTKVEEAHLAHWQGLINSTHNLFVSEIARGRNRSIDSLTAIADGRVFTGEEALSAGLIDGLRTLEEVLSQLSSAPVAKVNLMSQETTPATLQNVPVAMTLEQLEAKFPTASADFVLSQLKAKATSEQATDAWMAQLQRELAEAKQSLQAAQKTAPPPQKGEQVEGGNPRVGGQTPPPITGHSPQFSSNVSVFRSEVNRISSEILSRASTMRPMEARMLAVKQLKAAQPNLLDN